MHHNSMRTGFEVCACTVSSPHVRKKNMFHKLICVIRIFMRKISVVQCHPQNNFNIELFPNYGIYIYQCMNILGYLINEYTLSLGD